MIDPRHLSLTEWTDAVNLKLATAAPPTKITEGNWQLWADNMLAIPSIAALSPPDTRHFATWQEWAERFVQAVPL